MKKLLFLLLSFPIAQHIFSQGCVAIKSNGGYCSMPHTDDSKWQLSINNRYFKSFRHFSGTEEKTERVKLGTEVINHQYTGDIALIRNINPRWSVMVDLPMIWNTRSSLYEHKNVGRYTTSSFGLGDMRFAVYSWILDPVKAPKVNVQVGLGLKLPTGSYNYMDYFQLTDSTRVLGPVDQSIQLGDGGTGLTLELNSFYSISRVVSLYGNFYYLSNPREQNGVSTARGGVPSASTIANRSEVMSVADQYMFRAGLNVMFNHFTVSAGIRQEAIPVYDIIGGSNGFRRPGRILTGEPGVTYTAGKASLFAYVPVAIKRNRMQSVPDKLASERTGVYVIGDAAFADYAINIGASFRF